MRRTKSCAIFMTIVVYGILINMFIIKPISDISFSKYTVTNYTKDRLAISTTDFKAAPIYDRTQTETPLTSDQNKPELKTIMWYKFDIVDNMLRQSTRVDFSLCKFTNCQIKVLDTMINGEPDGPLDADAVLFQNGILNTPPPPRRDANQVFILGVRDSFVAVEYAEKNNLSEEWLSAYNWTMTYRPDSDIYYPYSYILPKEKYTELNTKDYEEIFNKKSNDAVWFVSHCVTRSHREDYVRELQTLISVTIFGDCGRKPLCPKPLTSCFDHIARKYKFYLAFENTFVQDYVSEKLFQWFNTDIIVVVRGGGNYSRIAPAGTIINAADFSSPVELARTLKEIGDDKEKYISYLKRKDQFYAAEQDDVAQDAYCKICEFLHNLDSHRKSYSDVRKWWEMGKMDN